MTEAVPGDQPPTPKPSPSPTRRQILAGGLSLVLIAAAGTVPGYLRGDYRSPEEKARDAEAFKKEYEQKHPLTGEYSKFSARGIRIRSARYIEIANQNYLTEAALIRQSESHGYNDSQIALPWDAAVNHKAVLNLDGVRVDTYRTSKELGSRLLARFLLDWGSSMNGQLARQELIVLGHDPVEINFEETGRSVFVKALPQEAAGPNGKFIEQGRLTIETVGRSFQ